MMSERNLPRAVRYENGELHLLDQRRLPQEEAFLQCRTVDDVIGAIKTLTVRGAPAIGIAAAYGLLLESHEADLAALREQGARLKAARPTAVNLAWAVDRMMQLATQHVDAAAPDRHERLTQEAHVIYDEDAKACRAIGDAGAALLKDRPNVLTHCNAGALAVSEYGTALAPIYRAHEQGTLVHVFVDETRPLLQGARLTAWELHRQGVDCTLITDNMAARMMAEGLVDIVIVGADRVAANGDVANKIGTLNLAILCKHFNLPFYVACPLSTVDAETASGQDIVIEERHADEVRQLGGQGTTVATMPVRNPAFDVTPAALVSGIITERGISAPDDVVKLLDN